MPTRGVRQEDPLSPYLSVLCMERLAHCIEDAVGRKDWRPIRLSKNGPPISHLFFADDLVLFAEASLSQVDIIGRCLDSFCVASGQKVNASKTRVFFSRNVNHVRSTQICHDLGFDATANLGKYLGVPLIHGRTSRHDYDFILRKAQQRLSNWKTSSLNLAGKCVLVNSIINTLPSYIMQTTRLPLSICDDTSKVARDFLWGSEGNGKRKIHHVGWNAVCKPKQDGGLGIRHLREGNSAFMMKNAWGLVSDKDSLWARVIRGKYKCGNDIIPVISKQRNCSNLWKGIYSIRDHFLDGLLWRVNSGAQTCFWRDKWVVGIDSLESYACCSFTEEERIKKVCQFINDDGSWNFSLFNNLLPNDIVMRIAGTMPPCDPLSPDIPAWRHSTDGSFTVASAYKSQIDTNPNMANHWKHIWKWEGPPKIQHFMWLAAQ